jgi:glutaminyl-tRNA synthetase
MESHTASPSRGGLDFIRAIVARDLATPEYAGRVVTRFPPEPNGYLHIGHAKSICLNFGIALENSGGACHLRFDDTNPTTEDVKYTESIQEDVRWLGFDWGENLFFASDYFERFYEYAEQLIREGKAYVDSSSEEDIREGRGTVTQPGRASPHRNRSVDENLDLFRRMRAGEFPNGAHVLRAKIDMAAPNMLMRDPLLYRIRHAHHYRSGDKWCIYPMYDFAHCLSDAIEGITHSLCTLEFKDNRALYDWVLDAVGIMPPRPKQIEFARLSLDYTVVSKRKLIRLVREGHVSGWDDPRMPTLAGLRRRGVTPEAIRKFCDMIGVARVDSRVDIGKLEYAIRDDLNQRVPRVMCVLRPLKVVIRNYPADRVEALEAPLYPRDVPLEGTRPVPFTRELYIDADDFRENPPAGFHRLAPGREVRLRYAYFLECEDVVKDPTTGEVVQLTCTYDPDTRGGKAPDGRTVKGTIHWVSAAHALPAEVRLYDRLFRTENPDDVPDGGDFISQINPDSLISLPDARIEPGIRNHPPGSRYQFERAGYFCSDIDSTPSGLVFNRTVTLRDTWAKQDAPVEPARRPRANAKRAPSPTAPSATEGSPPKAEKTKALAAAEARYVKELGLDGADADLLTRSATVSRFFEDALATYDVPSPVAKWIINEVLPASSNGLERAHTDGRAIGRLVALIDQGRITAQAGREVLKELMSHGGDPEGIVASHKLESVSDASALEPAVRQAIEANPDEVARYRAGKTTLLGFFVGQVMKTTRGRADAKLVQDLVRRSLDG